jgi:dipeptidyl aminopeptidase/acylaminoacyl peptidase
VAFGALAVTPPGDAVAQWVKRIVTREHKPGVAHARPGLRSLPAAGRLLVVSPAGAWIVGADGAQRRLGDWTGADWSPQGRFVVAWRGRHVAALDPRGNVRWLLTRGRIHAAAWAPIDGYRVAYVSGSALRVVAGDGTGDHPLAARVGPAIPAWSPTVLHRLAYADRRGRVVVVDSDARVRAWRSAPGGRVLQLAWTPDGSRLLALSPGSLRVLNARGRLLRRLAAPAGKRNARLAVAADRVALIRTAAITGRSEAVLLRAARRGERRLFSLPGTLADVAFSPDGRWLLLGWRAADQWLFLHIADHRVVAAGAIAAQFGPGALRPAFPRLAGWCC